MKKAEMIFKNQVTHIRAERDVLAAANILWIVELKCSFQVSFYIEGHYVFILFCSMNIKIADLSLNFNQALKTKIFR